MNNLGKRVEDLEKLGRMHSIASMFCYGLAIVLAITGFITGNDYARAFCMFCWVLGFVFSTQSYQYYNDRRVAILNLIVDKLLDVISDKEETPDEENKEEEK